MGCREEEGVFLGHIRLTLKQGGEVKPVLAYSPAPSVSNLRGAAGRGAGSEAKGQEVQSIQGEVEGCWTESEELLRLCVSDDEDFWGRGWGQWAWNWLSPPGGRLPHGANEREKLARAASFSI